MLTLDQLIAGFLLLLGLAAGGVSLFPLAMGLIAEILQYIKKLRSGKLFDIKVGKQ